MREKAIRLTALVFAAGCLLCSTSQVSGQSPRRRTGQSAATPPPATSVAPPATDNTARTLPPEIVEAERRADEIYRKFPEEKVKQVVAVLNSMVRLSRLYKINGHSIGDGYFNELRHMDNESSLLDKELPPSLLKGSLRIAHDAFLDEYTLRADQSAEETLRIVDKYRLESTRTRDSDKVISKATEYLLKAVNVAARYGWISPPK